MNGGTGTGSNCSELKIDQKHHGLAYLLNSQRQKHCAYHFYVGSGATHPFGDDAVMRFQLRSKSMNTN